MHFLFITAKLVNIIHYTLGMFSDFFFLFFSMELYRRLKTYVSLVYVEFWTEDQISVSGRNLSDVLDTFREYADRKISRISVDATHLLT